MTVLVSATVLTFSAFGRFEFLSYDMFILVLICLFSLRKLWVTRSYCSNQSPPGRCNSRFMGTMFIFSAKPLNLVANRCPPSSQFLFPFISSTHLGYSGYRPFVYRGIFFASFRLAQASITRPWLSVLYSKQLSM